MTEPSTAATAHYDAEHIRAIQAGLAACGLTTHLTDARAGLDLTATLSPSRMRRAEFLGRRRGLRRTPLLVSARHSASRNHSHRPPCPASRHHHPARPGPCLTSGSPSGRSCPMTAVRRETGSHMSRQSRPS